MSILNQNDSKVILDLPTADEICGAESYYGFDSGKLKTFKRTGTVSLATDFAKYLDCIVGRSTAVRARVPKYFYSKFGVCEIYTKSASFKHDNPVVINSRGEKEFSKTSRASSGIRPVIRNFSKLGIDVSNTKRYINGIKVIEYGFYPQIKVSDDVSKKLSFLENSNHLIKTKSIFTGKIKNITGDYQYTDVCEYMPDKSSIKFAKMTYYGFHRDDSKDINGQTLWFYVSPIEWIVDEKADMLISMYVLAAFPNFTYANESYYEENYENTEIFNFLKNIMSPQICGLPGNNIEDVKELEEDDSNYSYNPYNFKFDKVDNDDIIEGALDAGLSVFLHGASGVGKSARVLEIDEDAEIVYVCNESRDGFMGKSVYNPEKDMMKDVPPVWYDNLVAKCKRNPNKMHILFLDELTMADIYVQKMVFNLILSRRLDGKWELPENVRIITAGNETKDSMAANPLVEPLFGRLVHVYIEDSLSSWLSWASFHNIHPAIYAYIAYTNGKVLRTAYNGVTPNADPRRWEMASKMLYATENPETLVSVIGSELTNSFIEFCKTKVITLEDVLNNNYNKEALNNLSLSEKYATTMCLTGTNENDFIKVREFVSLMGAEFISLFDSLWAHDNESRLELITEVRMMDKTKKRVLE